MKLTDRFNDEVEYQGLILKLNMSFDNVLRVTELLKDDLFSQYEKIPLLFEMLVKNANDFDLSFTEIDQIIGFLFDNVLAPKKNDDPGSSDGKKYHDLEQDAHFIYASFLQAYKMDLFEMQGVLHWHKFLALLENLPENTKFKEVVGIRAQKIPTSTEYNQEERNRIIKLKRIYRLEGDVPSVAEADAALSSIGNAIKKSAERDSKRRNKRQVK